MRNSGRRNVIPDPPTTASAAPSRAPFFDDAASHQLELLSYRLHYDDSLQLLIGAPGSGRSSLLEQLAERAPDSLLLVVLDATSAPPPDDAARALLEALQCEPPQGELELTGALARQLTGRAERGLATVLALDDADCLDDAALAGWIAWWCDWQAAAPDALRLLLGGDELLIERARGLLGEDAAAPALSRLRPLGIGRARAFLGHHLCGAEEAAEGDDFPFTPAQLGELYRRSGGLPGPLLEAAREALRRAAPVPNARGAAWRAGPRRAGAAAAGGLAALTALAARGAAAAALARQRLGDFAVRLRDRRAMGGEVADGDGRGAEPGATVEAEFDLASPVPPDARAESTSAAPTDPPAAPPADMAAAEHPAEAPQPALDDPSAAPAWQQRFAAFAARLPTWAGDRRARLGAVLILLSLPLFLLDDPPPEPVGPVVRQVPIHLPAATPEPPVAPGTSRGVDGVPEPTATQRARDRTGATDPDRPGASATGGAPARSASGDGAAADAGGGDEPRAESQARAQPAREAAQGAGRQAEPAAEPPPLDPVAPLAPPLGLMAAALEAADEVRAAPANTAAAASADAGAAPVDSAAQAAAPAAAGGDHQWLLAQDGAHYSLQLLAAAQPQSLNEFARDNGLVAAQLRQFSLRRGGQTLYVLLHGLYADRAAARRALAQMPEAVRSQRPWIRSLASIQGAIREQ